MDSYAKGDVIMYFSIMGFVAVLILAIGMTTSLCIVILKKNEGLARYILALLGIFATFCALVGGAIISTAIVPSQDSIRDTTNPPASVSSIIDLK